MNGYKISSTADPTIASNALTKNYISQTSLPQSTTLDAISATLGNISLNSHKITDLADASGGTDCVSRQYGDSRYYINTTPLD
jgi:hypothetical protein